MGIRKVSVAAIALMCVMSLGSAAGATGRRHCSYRLQPIAHHGRVTEARLVDIGCYRTHAAARRAGRAEALLLIGTEYNGANYSGSTQDYYAPDTCQGNIYEVSYVGDTWNDKFQSGKGFGGCDHNKKFAAANFGGDVLTCTPNCSGYGSLANEVSSLRWRP